MSGNIVPWPKHFDTRMLVHMPYSKLWNYVYIWSSKEGHGRPPGGNGHQHRWNQLLYQHHQDPVKLRLSGELHRYSAVSAFGFNTCLFGFVFSSVVTGDWSCQGRIVILFKLHLRCSESCASERANTNLSKWVHQASIHDDFTFAL